jgi:hypothetical protein
MILYSHTRATPWRRWVVISARAEAFVFCQFRECNVGNDRFHRLVARLQRDEPARVRGSSKQFPTAFMGNITGLRDCSTRR